MDRQIDGKRDRQTDGRMDGYKQAVQKRERFWVAVIWASFAPKSNIYRFIILKLLPTRFAGSFRVATGAQKLPPTRQEQALARLSLQCKLGRLKSLLCPVPFELRLQVFELLFEAGIFVQDLSEKPQNELERWSDAAIATRCSRRR